MSQVEIRKQKGVVPTSETNRVRSCFPEGRAHRAVCAARLLLLKTS